MKLVFLFSATIFLGLPAFALPMVGDSLTVSLVNFENGTKTDQIEYEIEYLSYDASIDQYVLRSKGTAFDGTIHTEEYNVSGASLAEMERKQNAILNDCSGYGGHLKDVTLKSGQTVPTCQKERYLPYGYTTISNDAEIPGWDLARMEERQQGADGVLRKTIWEVTAFTPR